MQRKPLTNRQLENALKVRIEKVRTSVEAFRSSDNPQVRDMFLRAQGELQGLEAAKDAISQRTVYFLEN